MFDFIKKISRLVLVNLWVVLSISIILFLLSKIFGININDRSGILLIIASVIWFGGALASLFLSKISAKSAYDMQMITLDNIHILDAKSQSIYNIINTLSSQNGINLPEIGIYTSSEPNAFATWSSKNNCLIAVSTWLITLMKEDEIKWVLWHELTHVLNWDMVTMTLINGVLNTFVFWLSRVVSMGMRWDNEKSSGYNPFVTLALERVLGFFGMIVSSRFSRIREYKADLWSAKIRNNKSYMLLALQKLSLYEWQYEVSSDTNSNLKIISGKYFMNLFSTHPKLQDRIVALQNSDL